MRGRSSKPCVGCGKLPKQYEDTWTSEKPLCHECKVAIRDFPQSQKIVERYTKKKVKSLRVHGAPHWFPYIPHDSIHFINDAEEKDPAKREFRRVWFDLMLAASEESTDGKWTDDPLIPSRDGHGNEQRLFEASLIQPLRDVYIAATALAARAYLEGQKNGSDLLGRMMSGEIKNEEINERCREDKA